MSIEAMKQEPKATSQFVEKELTVGQRHTNSGQQLLEEIESLYAAIQQAEAQQPATCEPVYWEWRHQGSHPDSVDFGQWSEWKRVEPRSALHTVEDALNEFRGYIARGLKYELRALYTHPAPGVPDDVVRVKLTPLTDAQMEKGREQIFSINNPYCPCDRKTFKKVAQWVERHHRIGITAQAKKETP